MKGRALSAFAIALLGLCASPAYSAEAGLVRGGSLGINLLSPAAALLPVPLSTFSSVLANLEPGVAASVGADLGEWTSLEVRGSFGPNSDTEQVFGAQLGGRFHFCRALRWGPDGAYVGGGARWWDLSNQLTGVHRRNVAGTVTLGHRWNFGSVYFDARAHELLAIYTWSTDPHTEPGGATLADPWLPKVPLFSFDLGFNFR